jgi:hypothetical protein
LEPRDEVFRFQIADFRAENEAHDQRNPEIRTLSSTLRLRLEEKAELRTREIEAPHDTT